MYEPKKLSLLKPNDFKVLKVIQIEGPKHSWFTGYLPYLRNFTGDNGYNRSSSDLLDEKILDVIRQTLPDSFLKYSIDILWEGQLEENLQGIQGGSEKGLTIQFNPLLPFDLAPQFVGKDFFAYPIRLIFGCFLRNMKNVNIFMTI